MGSLITLDIEFDVLIKLEHSHKEGCWYASSPFSEVVRHGKTEQQALERFKDAFEIMVTSSLEFGTLMSIFQRNGYVIQEVEHTPTSQKLRFRLPSSKIEKRKLLPFDGLVSWNKHIIGNAPKELCLS